MKMSMLILFHFCGEIQVKRQTQYRAKSDDLKCQISKIKSDLNIELKKFKEIQKTKMLILPKYELVVCEFNDINNKEITLHNKIENMKSLIKNLELNFARKS